ncbi:hypothetical protein C8R45DRAFT_934412 [Mycena sanguinolenta]|nr:hypothetical protein C8R45DRAFT_934412 [Mycena sanguinolenta]
MRAKKDGKQKRATHLKTTRHTIQDCTLAPGPSFSSPDYMGPTILGGFRHALQKQGTSDEDSDDEEQDDRKWLAADIKKWHQQQQDICPQVIPLVVAEPYTSPELDKPF